jgi:hypothetical protein
LYSKKTIRNLAKLNAAKVFINHSSRVGLFANFVVYFRARGDQTKVHKNTPLFSPPDFIAKKKNAF